MLPALTLRLCVSLFVRVCLYIQGKGFPVERIPASDFPTVLMFATGSGISPIKAVIESGVLEADKRKKVKLYYGTKSAGEYCTYPSARIRVRITHRRVQVDPKHTVWRPLRCVCACM